MKFAVLHVNKSSYTSTSPTMRIARYVYDRLRVRGCVVNLIHDVETAQSCIDTRHDIVFVKYGVLAFSDHRKQAIDILNRARRVINMENDYSFVHDKRLRSPDEIWSTVQAPDRTRYCNWNVLTRHDTKGWITDTRFVPYFDSRPKNSGLIYYGAYRPDRVQYFERYFKNAPYPVTISSFRGDKNFGVLCPNAKLMPAFRDPDGPAKWEMTLYVEDATSHSLYCSPANRFYECLHMGLPQAIDERAVKTLMTAGIPMKGEFQVHSKMGLRALLQRAGDIAALQQRLWRRDYASDLHQQFDDAMRSSGLW